MTTLNPLQSTIRMMNEFTAMLERRSDMHGTNELPGDPGLPPGTTQAMCDGPRQTPRPVIEDGSTEFIRRTERWCSEEARDILVDDIADDRVSDMELGAKLRRSFSDTRRNWA
jgi:hypothetical protein